MKSLVGWPCRAVGCRTARVLDGCGGRRKQVRQVNAQRRGSSVPELRYVSRRSGTVRGACERSRAQQPLCRGRERAVQVPDSSSINRDAAISNTSFVCWARTPGSGLCGMPSGSPSGLAPGCPAAVRRRRCRRSPAGGGMRSPTRTGACGGVRLLVGRGGLADGLRRPRPRPGDDACANGDDRALKTQLSPWGASRGRAASPATQRR
jgi:hypothetical protein